MKKSLAIRLLQQLLFDVDFREVLANREKSRDLNRLLLSKHTNHLHESHQFNKLNREYRKNFWKEIIILPYSFLRILISYELKIFRFIKWSVSLSPKDSSKEREYAVIRGLGYQQLNEFIPREEIIDSLPNWIFYSESKEKIQFFIEGSETGPTNKNGSVQKNLFSILTYVFTSRSRNILPLLKVLVTSQLIVILSVTNSKIRSVIEEIPELFILLNADISAKQLLIIDTQGSFEHLPIFHYLGTERKNFRNIMIHYSEGGMPYTDSQRFLDGLIPGYERAPVDMHIVWTQEFADFYNGRGERENFRPAGPQIFRKTHQHKLPTPPQPQGFVIVFDETPSYIDEAFEHTQEAAGLSFLDVLALTISDLRDFQSDPPLILLKQKRRNLITHSKSYLDKLEALEESGFLKLVPWHSNPFILIPQSIGVLATLGSSPALIGRHLGVPTAYGYFGEKVISQPIIDYGFRVIRNNLELASWIQSLR